MSKLTDNLRKNQSEAADRIEQLEAQLYRTKAYFLAYAVSKGNLSFNDEVPGFTNSIGDIFNEVDTLLGDK